MAQALFLVISAGITSLVSWIIIGLDQRRLRGPELDRAWNLASLVSAVVAFPLICIPVHFIRTRRNLAGVGLAAEGLLHALVAVVGLSDLVARLLGIPDA